MTDVKVYPDKHLRYVFIPANGIANPLAPTHTELNAGVDLSKATAWEGTSINPSDSSDIDDAAITDSATAVEPGFDQYEVALSFFYPKDMTKVTDPYVIAYETFAPGRVKGYIARRFVPADVNTNTSSAAFAAGDFVELFLVVSDYTAQDTEGEDSTKFTVNFLPQGFMSGPVMVKSVTAVTVAPTTKALAVAGKAAIAASVGSRNVTQRVVWTSSDTSKATVSSNGVVRGVAAGTATITATYANAGTAGTCTVTVS